MKNNILLYIVLLFTSMMIYACSKDTNPNRVYFNIDPCDRKIIIPVQLNDSITANMVFDSAGQSWMFSLDSSFVAGHPVISSDIFPDTVLSGSAWGYSRYPELRYKDISHKMKIGSTDITYNVMGIMNWKRAMRNDNMDGLFSIPENDTTHVWELNFEHNYLEIHSTEHFKMPENCLLYPSVYEVSFVLQIPMCVKFTDGDTLTVNYQYTVDSGMAFDVVLVRPDEPDFFNKREDAVWTDDYDWYSCYYTVNATLSDNFVADSLRIYTYDKTPLKSEGLIGINFLKRFNVFFDMKNKQIGLQPIKNFKRIFNPKGRRFHYLIEPNIDNKFIITFMADYKKNYYKNAGLKVGDEVVAINGVSYKSITYEQKDEYYKEDSLLFDIIRSGKPMQVVVKVDKMEEQGD